MGAADGAPGIEALVRLMAGLRADFPGALLVVQHLPASVASVLRAILSRARPLVSVGRDFAACPACGGPL
jgi:two-component system chemotaxis response regulator CheB